MRSVVNSTDIDEKLGLLIDRWCSRKELKPLRKVLNGQAGINGLADGWWELLNELKTIRVQDRGKLRDDEYHIVVESIHLVEKALEDY